MIQWMIRSLQLGLFGAMIYLTLTNNAKILELTDTWANVYAIYAFFSAIMMAMVAFLFRISIGPENIERVLNEMSDADFKSMDEAIKKLYLPKNKFLLVLNNIFHIAFGALAIVSFNWMFLGLLVLINTLMGIYILDSINMFRERCEENKAKKPV
jgi:hypothetical protein